MITVAISGRRSASVLPGATNTTTAMLNVERFCWYWMESHRGRDQDPRQQFYSGLKRERELEHDAQVYQAYLSIADRLEERDARIERVVLDYELKREYQEWLHARDWEREVYDGHPDRDARESHPSFGIEVTPVSAN